MPPCSYSVCRRSSVLRALSSAARASRTAFASCALVSGTLPPDVVRRLASASCSAAAASERCAARSRDSSTAMTSPARTGRFFASPICAIWPAIFGMIVASRRAASVATVVMSLVIVPRSAFATCTLTTTVASSSPPLWQLRQISATTRSAAPTAAAAMTRDRFILQPPL